MRVEIRRIQQELGITTVYVSHDQEECFSISDQVAIMNKGIIEQLSDPATIYKYPETKFVADFIGFKNFIDFDKRTDHDGKIELNKSGYSFVLHKDPQMSNSTGKIGAIRPDDLLIREKDNTGAVQENSLPGRVKVSTYLGRSYQYVVETPIGDFTVNKEMAESYRTGQEIILEIPRNQMVLVD
jgi:putative spermidine/putrescine transport system ATP-binding protein